MILAPGPSGRRCWKWRPGAARTFTLLEFEHGAADLAGSPVAEGGPAGLVSNVFAARGTLAIDDYDIADPFGRQADEYQRILERVRVAGVGVASALIGN